MERSLSVDICNVCHEHMDIFAIGSCNHPICFRCSSRMRFLCEQMYCPICRGDLNKVVFIQYLAKFENINLDQFKISKKSIFLENVEVEESFKQLLTIQCKLCPNRDPEKSIDSLRDHLRKDHTLFLCDLCLQHLNIFPFERKCYNRKDLATHRRIGDTDDKSYKGHPLCVFCDERYMDNDELLRHLRKDHYFCHFCDADGTNEYYNDYPDLKTHFQDSHFLCDEEDCGNPLTQFTNAFHSNIDLKAHRASKHTKGMSKSQIREASRLDIEIQLPPRRSGRDRGRITGRDYEEMKYGSRGGYGTGTGRGGYRNQDNYQDEREELERAIEASKHDAPGVKKMSWSADDIRQDFPALSSQELTPTTSSAIGAAPTTSSSTVTTTSTKLTTTMATKISNEQTFDKVNKAFPQLKKSGTKANNPLNNKSDKSGRNSPVVKDKKGTDRNSPVVRVMQPVPTKKVTEEDFPDLASSKSRNSNLISLGVWTQKSQRTDIVEVSKPPVKEVKPKLLETKSNSLASVGMSLCLDNDNQSFPSGKAKPSLNKKPTVKPSNEKDFPALSGKSERKHSFNNKNDKLAVKPSSEKDFPSLSKKSEPIPSFNIKSDKPSMKSSSEKDFQSLDSKSDNKPSFNNKSDKPMKSSNEKDFPILSGKPVTQTQSQSNNKKSAWGQKRNYKSSKANVDNDFEIPTSATSVADIKTESESKVEPVSSSKKKKNKKKNKEFGDNSSESIVDIISPLLPLENNLHKSEKSTFDSTMKQKASCTNSEIPSSLDGIAMDLLNEEKGRTTSKSTNPKDVSSSSCLNLAVVEASAPIDPVASLTSALSSLSDFPSLSTSAKAPPPGFQKSCKKPPPGFGTSTGPSRPPPGFEKKEEPVPEPPAPKPPVIQSTFTYIKPNQFQERNQQLVKTIRQYLVEPEKFDEFKTKSWQFRQNEIMASEYYYSCEKLIGKEKFGEVFQELLILLPDITKQQDLLSSHTQAINKLNNVLRISARTQKAPWSVFNDFMVCPTCSQVLSQKDNTVHTSNHSVNDFPALGRTNSSKNDFMGMGSWVTAK